LRPADTSWNIEQRPFPGWKNLPEWLPQRASNLKGTGDGGFGYAARRAFSLTGRRGDRFRAKARNVATFLASRQNMPVSRRRYSATRVSPALLYVRDRLAIPWAYQVTLEGQRDSVEDGVPGVTRYLSSPELKSSFA